MKAWARRPGTRQRSLAPALTGETRKAFFKIRLSESWNMGDSGGRVFIRGSLGRDAPGETRASEGPDCRRMNTHQLPLAWPLKPSLTSTGRGEDFLLTGVLVSFLICPERVDDSPLKLWVPESLPAPYFDWESHTCNKCALFKRTPILSSWILLLSPTFPSQLHVLHFESPLRPFSAAILSMGVSHLLEHGPHRQGKLTPWGGHQLPIALWLSVGPLGSSCLHTWILSDLIFCMSFVHSSSYCKLMCVTSLPCLENQVSLLIFHCQYLQGFFHCLYHIDPWALASLVSFIHCSPAWGQETSWTIFCLFPS